MRSIKSNRSRGFNLVELLIVVAIIGILAGIAYPSYTEYVRRSHRAEAQTALQQAAQHLQRFYVAHNSYDTQLNGQANPGLPDGLKHVPNQGNVAYDLNLVAVTPTTYMLTATPAGSMFGDRCGMLKLDHLGRKFVVIDNKDAPAMIPECWK